MVTSVLLSRLHWTVKCLERSSVTCESGIDTIGLGLLGHLFVAHRCHISRVAQADFRSHLLLSAFCCFRSCDMTPPSPPPHRSMTSNLILVSWRQASEDFQRFSSPKLMCPATPPSASYIYPFDILEAVHLAARLEYESVNIYERGIHEAEQRRRHGSFEFRRPSHRAPHIFSLQFARGMRLDRS